MATDKGTTTALIPIMGRSLLFLFILSLFSVLVFAQGQGYIENIPDSLAKGKLNASISSRTIACNETPCSIEFNITASNPSNRAIRLYVAEKVDSDWRIVLDLGQLAINESAPIVFTLNFVYAGQTTYDGSYAIITDNLLKKEFMVSEDWAGYESKAKEYLAVGGFVVAPVIALVILFIIYLFSKMAERRRFLVHPGEFTMQNLFAFPTRGSFGERATLVLANPIFWAVALFFAFLLMGSLIVLTYKDADLVVVSQIAIISLVAAALVPILLMLLSWYSDIYEREPLRMVTGMFMWGIISAFLTFFISGTIMYLFGKSAEGVPILFVSVFGSLLISPVIEEIIKAIGLSVMAQHHEFDDMMDGLIYGFAIGLGFAMMENWFYFITRVNPLTVGLEAWISAILYRSFFNTIAHGCFTAFVGALVGMVKSKGKFKEYFMISIFPGVFVAIILHIIFNFTAYLDIIAIAQYRTVVILFNPILVVTAAAGVVLIYVLSLMEGRAMRNQEKKSLEYFSSH